MNWLRSRWAPIFGGLFGLGAVTWLIREAGPELVWNSICQAGSFFPWVVLFEGLILTCTVAALRLLYREDRHKIPLIAFVRTGLISYAVMGLLPAGRAAAEAGRAALLAKYCSAARATAAAVKLQGVALIANAAISIFAAIGVGIASGASVALLLILANLGLTAVLGVLILGVSRRSTMGRWLAKRLGNRLPQLHTFGDQLDQQIQEGPTLPLSALALEFLGRIIQMIQHGLLVVAVGGGWSLVSALCAHALHLIGVAAGELIPAQLGATEAAFQLLSSTLKMSASDAISIALLAHASQIFWIAIGSATPLLLKARDAPQSDSSRAAKLP